MIRLVKRTVNAVSLLTFARIYVFLFPFLSFYFTSVSYVLEGLSEDVLGNDVANFE